MLILMFVPNDSDEQIVLMYNNIKEKRFNVDNDKYHDEKI